MPSSAEDVKHHHRLEEETQRTAKKTNRALRRLCRLSKERAGKERQWKAFNSFCRAFAEMKAYAIAYLLTVKLDAASVMELRTDLRHAMFAYLRMRQHFRSDEDIAKVDKMMERKFIKTNRLILQEENMNDYEEDVGKCE